MVKLVRAGEIKGQRLTGSCILGRKGVLDAAAAMAVSVALPCRLIESTPQSRHGLNYLGGCERQLTPPRIILGDYPRERSRSAYP